MIDHAFEAACMPHRPALMQRALRLVANRSDAEDLVQDVLIASLTAWRERGSNPAPAQPGVRSWLMRLLMNMFVSHYRKAVGRREIAEDFAELIAENTVGEAGPAPDAGTYTNEVRGVVRGALKTLPIRQRYIIQSHAFEDKFCREIAEERGMPVGTVFPTLGKARAKLAKVLADEAA